MKMEHLGNGIALFSNVIDIDRSFIDSYVGALRLADQQSKYINEQGVLKNMGGYIFSEESISVAPERFIETLPAHELITDEMKAFIFRCEELLYEAAVEYCRLFPVAVEAITWRIRGHIATYKNGQNIGCHSDSSVPGELGKQPNNQNSLHNTLTSGMLWTDDYEGGELAFRMWGISVKPPAGSIVIYPSTFIGAHEVMPVTEGERISYLQWFCHGYLPTGMPPLDDRNNHQYAQYKWLPNLKEDVGTDFLYQRSVI